MQTDTHTHTYTITTGTKLQYLEISDEFNGIFTDEIKYVHTKWFRLRFESLAVNCWVNVFSSFTKTKAISYAYLFDTLPFRE